MLNVKERTIFQEGLKMKQMSGLRTEFRLRPRVTPAGYFWKSH